MTKEQYLEQLGKNSVEVFKLLEKKAADYVPGDDPFINFRDPDGISNIPDEVCRFIIIRIRDKFRRLITVLSKGSVEVLDETVEDTIKDLMGYPNLLLCYLQEQSGTTLRTDMYNNTPPAFTPPAPPTTPTTKISSLKNLFGFDKT